MLNILPDPLVKFKILLYYTHINNVNINLIIMDIHHIVIYGEDINPVVNL